MSGYSILTLREQLTMLSGEIVLLSALAFVLAWIADRPWGGRHTRDDDAPMPPARSMARRTGEGGGGAVRLAGPGGAPATVPISPVTPRPYVVPDTDPTPLAELYAAYCRDVDTVVDAIPDSVIEAKLQALLDEHAGPPLVVDSPPGALGTQPAGDVGVPVVRRWACSLCQDGRDVIGNACIWCGHPHPAAAS